VLTIVWTEYFKYRAQTRGFDLNQIEQILRYSSERYRDAETSRLIAIGRHGSSLIMIAYEVEGSIATPITVHTISRQQVRFRVQTGRFVNE